MMQRYVRIFVVCLGISTAYLLLQYIHCRMKAWKTLDYSWRTPLKIQTTEWTRNRPTGKPNEVRRVLNRSNTATNDMGDICNEFVSFSEVIKPSAKTSLFNWSFNTSVKCPLFSLEKYSVPRLKIVLECNGDNGRLVKLSTNSSQDISVTEFGNACLLNVIEKCCTGNLPVPNVIHYVWFYTKDMSYFHFLSMMSTLRFVKPCLVLIHGPSKPTGKYWDYIVSVMPNIIHVKRPRPTKIFGHELAYKTHSSDVMRIEAVMYYGGIFMDFDQVVLRPLEPLRIYPYTQGREIRIAMGSQLIMAKKNASFLHLWYNSYKSYSTQWSWNALLYPDKLARKFPHLIHVEGYNFTRPAWEGAVQFIHKGNYDWSTNYGMHMFERSNHDEINITIIRRLNTTVGSVSRHILFGNKELCEE